MYITMLSIKITHIIYDSDASNILVFFLFYVVRANYDL